MLVLLITTALVATTGLLIGARFAGGSVLSWFLGAFVVASAEVILLSLAASAAGAFTRWPLVGGSVAVLAAAVVSRPRLPPLQPAARALRHAFREPAVAILGAAAAVVTVFSAALATIPPPNDHDAIAYHLARAAFWTQQERIGSIPGAADSRLDAFSPNGEIAMAFTMAVSGSGRFAPLVQLFAAMACAVAVCGIARRLGMGVRTSILGGLLFLTAPVVALQASTALNDVIVAAFAGCSAFFLLGTSKADKVFAATSVALLVGTKLTGVLSLPGLALLAAVAHGRRSAGALVALAGGALAGCYWYGLNVLQGRDAFGRIGGERVSSDAVAAAGRVIRLALAAFETPGAVGWDRLLYLLAALIVGIACAAAAPRRARVVAAVTGAGAVLLPLLVIQFERVVLRANQKAFATLGREDVGFIDADRSATKASPIFSWYGAPGTLLTTLAVVVAAREVRRGRLPAATLVVASAPLLWIVLVGIGVPYWEWNGRYAIGGFVLGAATWGLVLRWRPLAWATAAVVALTTLLGFVHLHDRPAGVRLLEPNSKRSVWTEPDWELQATDNPHLLALYRFFDERVPLRDRVAVEPEIWPGGANIGGNIPPFPFFGRDLTRTVRLADSPAAAAETGAQWALLRRPDERCVAGWRRAFRHGPWLVLRREPSAACG